MPMEVPATSAAVRKRFDALAEASLSYVAG
jgi:hypothetical protein